MRKYENPLEELKVLRKFMKEKKIKYTEVSTEMDCSTPHLISVFNGQCPLTEKFRRAILKSFHALLEKDLLEFYSLLTYHVERKYPWEALI